SRTRVPAGCAGALPSRVRRRCYPEAGEEAPKIDDGAAVAALHEKRVARAGLDRELDLLALDRRHPRLGLDHGTRQCRRAMAYVDVGADRALALLEARPYALVRRGLEEADKDRGRHHLDALVAEAGRRMAIVRLHAMTVSLADGNGLHGASLIGDADADGGICASFIDTVKRARRPAFPRCG